MPERRVVELSHWNVSKSRRGDAFSSEVCALSTSSSSSSSWEPEESSPWEKLPVGQLSRIGRWYKAILIGPLRYIPMILTQLAFIPLLYSFFTFSLLEKVLGLNLPLYLANVFSSLNPSVGYVVKRTTSWLFQLPLSSPDEVFWRYFLQIILPLMPVLYFLVVVPLVDIVIGRDGGFLKKLVRAKRKGRKDGETGYRLICWLYGLIYMSLFAMSAAVVSSLPNVLSLVAVTVGLGFYGSILITVSHELLHSKESSDRFLSKVLLSMVCYMHWQKAHTLIHHVRVATPSDPSSAPRGQHVYAFIKRSICENWQLMHEIETSKWTRASWILVPLLIAEVLIFVGGLEALLLYLGSSVVAVVMLEIVNYIEHYGLQRELLPNGKYEQVSTKHSWNADWLFTNCNLINLQLHSEHHLNSNRPYWQLKNHENGPQMPAPYPAMILLTLVPPLWFRVMDKRLDEMKQKGVI